MIKIVSRKDAKVKAKAHLCANFAPLRETPVLEFAADANIHCSDRYKPACVTRCISRHYYRRDDPGKQSGLLGTHLLAARTRAMARLDAD